MTLSPCLRELRDEWLPHITDQGLDRVIELLEKGSPLLIHGAFMRALPMGCLATHIAWNHPATKRFTMEAGIMWLSRVAHLNPATSQVIRSWDARGPHDWELRSSFSKRLRKCADGAMRSNRATKRLANPLLHKHALMFWPRRECPSRLFLFNNAISNAPARILQHHVQSRLGPIALSIRSTPCVL